MGSFQQMTADQVTIFTWWVAILFYGLGAACLWNLAVTASHWLWRRTRVTPRHGA